MRYHLNFRDLNEGNRDSSRFHREAFKLRKHLVDFKPDLIDLWGSIVTLPRNGGFAAHFRLHLPSGTLTAEGRGFTRVSAWGAVVDETVTRITRHKARLLGSRSRVRRDLDEQRWHVPLDEPTKNGQEIRTSVQAGYNDLLAFIQSEIGLHVKNGNLPQDAVDPIELADVVVMEVLQRPESKPVGLSYEHWFYKVAYEQLLEAIDTTRHDRARPDLGPEVDSLVPAFEGPEGITDEEGLVEEWIRPSPRSRLADQIPDPRSLPQR